MKGKNMVEVTLPYEFVGGSKAIANQVNANFEAVTRGFTGINVALEELKAEVEKFNNKPLRDSFDIIVSLVGTAPTGAYPLWTGEWIYNARSIYKDFWAKALEYKKGQNIRTLSTAEYEAEVEEYGETGAFVVDELNGHIRLPKIIHFVSGLSELSELGKPFHDSLPEHSHKVYQNNGTYGASSSIFQSLGPLTNPGSAKGIFETGGVSNNGDSLHLGSETAPKHIKCAVFIQVANNTAEISAMDTAVIAQELSDAIDDIEAKGAEVIAEVEDLAAEKVNLLNQTTTTNVGFIETAGSEQKALVTAEGVKQTDLVTAAGSNLVTTGNEQVARVVAAGDEKIAAAENWAIGEIADCPFGSAKYWANEAKNNVNGQELVIALDTTAGSISLETNNIYKLVCSGAVNFVLPASVNNAIHNQIKVMVNMPAVYAVDWGTNGRYFNNEAPDISETGNYDFYFDYDAIAEAWVAGALKKGPTV